MKVNSNLGVCTLLSLALSLLYNIAGGQSKSSLTNTPSIQDSTKGLKDFYKEYFPMGVAVSPRSLQGAEGDLIIKHFSSMTPENVMKMGPIHPTENEYSWASADQIADFAQQHNLKLRGHTLCWHQQTPDWLFKDEKGNDVSKEVLLQRLKDHITAVVSRYKGKIYAWDVVNEAVSDDSTKLYRDSPWYRICGEEFIAKAFEYAHQADPNALLFYNDYNAILPKKAEHIYELCKKLKDANVPIHGIGLQGHWNVYDLNEKDLRNALEKYSSLGLKLQITELDMSIYHGENGRRDRRPDESDVFTPVLEQKQIDQYKMVFNVLREYKDFITGVTFWNVSDKHSWLDNFPVRGRKNYPLLFNQELKQKKVYWEVVKF